MSSVKVNTVALTANDDKEIQTFDRKKNICIWYKRWNNAIKQRSSKSNIEERLTFKIKWKGILKNITLIIKNCVCLRPKAP